MNEIQKIHLEFMVSALQGFSVGNTTAEIAAIRASKAADEALKLYLQSWPDLKLIYAVGEAQKKKGLEMQKFTHEQRENLENVFYDFMNKVPGDSLAFSDARIAFLNWVRTNTKS